MAENQRNLHKADVLANIFNITVRSVQRLTTDGILPAIQTQSGRRYDLLPTIKAYIMYLDSRVKGKDQPKSVAENEALKLAAEVKLKQAKAEMAAYELKELKGQMFRADDVEKLTNELVFAVRSLILSMPGRVAMDVANISDPNEVNNYLTDIGGEMLEELARHEYDPDAYKKLVRERAGWQREEVADIDEENDEETENDE